MKIKVSDVLPGDLCQNVGCWHDCPFFVINKTYYLDRDNVQQTYFVALMLHYNNRKYAPRKTILELGPYSADEEIDFLFDHRLLKLA